MPRIQLAKVHSRFNDTEIVDIEDGHYVMDGNTLIAFAIHNHSDDDHDYYMPYVLRKHDVNHRGWFSSIMQGYSFISSASKGSRLGANFAAEHFGPNGIKPGAAAGLIAGTSVSYVVGQITRAAYDHYAGHAMCYVNSQDEEVYWGPYKV